MAAVRQSAVPRSVVRRRRATIRLSVTAPEITLTVVKVAASISSCPNASRHSNELAANAPMATTVNNTVRGAMVLELLDGMRPP